MMFLVAVSLKCTSCS